jgi:hypothetical protein
MVAIECMPGKYKRNGKDKEYVTDHTTAMRVRAETRERLKNELNRGETYDKLINRLLYEHGLLKKVAYKREGVYIKGETNALLVEENGMRTIFDTIGPGEQQLFAPDYISIKFILRETGSEIRRLIPTRTCDCRWLTEQEREEIEKSGLII